MHKRFRSTRLLIVSILLVALSGCWIPENFDAKVTLNKDGSYTFIYDGTLAFALAVAAAKDRALSANDEAQLRREAETLRREPGIKSVEYQGKGRYKVLFEKSGKPGEPLDFLGICSIRRQPDGTVAISGARPSRKDLEELNRLGANIDGQLSVSVPFRSTVVRHNAQSEPSFWGLFGAYKWEIKSPGANPVIIVRPSS
jgi:hypothetical protein